MDRLLPSDPSRAAVLPGCALKELVVSVCHACDASPVSPREDAAAPRTTATGTRATSTTSAVPMRWRSRALRATRSMPIVAAQPAIALRITTISSTSPKSWPAAVRAASAWLSWVMA